MARHAFVPSLLFILYAAAVFFRPLLPVDETRYLSVAWEMFLRGDWRAPLTVNFEPYHHKPPLLFWLINISWSVFGVSRWAAAIPPVLSSLGCVYLTAALAGKLDPELRKNAPYIMAGSLPFIIYSTFIMFDLTLTVFVLFTLLCLLEYAEKGKFKYIILAGLFLGAGVLTKGPVAYLYVIFPVLAGPLRAAGSIGRKKWYGGCALAFLLSVPPVLLWLVPVLRDSSREFGFWLVWEQTAGRISGSYGEAHTRPFYFYLPIIPLMFAPWIFMPRFWKGLRALKAGVLRKKEFRFVLCWAVPVFVAFSFIGGKQPHYLVPLLPAAVILIAVILKDAPVATIRNVMMIMVFVFAAGHAAAARTYFPSYDLRPYAAYVQNHDDIPWAFVRNYQGEITFLARLRVPVASLERNQVNDWLAGHPGGMVMIRYKNAEEVSAYKMHFSAPYRGKRMGVFSAAEYGSGI